MSDYSEEELEKELKKIGADEYSEEETKRVLEEEKEKFEKFEKDTPSLLKKIWDKVKLLRSLLTDYIAKKYTDINKKSIALITAGLVYLFMPFDLIPDFIPGLGFADDLGVLTMILKQLSDEIEKYKIWKDNQEANLSDSENFSG